MAIAFVKKNGKEMGASAPKTIRAAWIQTTRKLSPATVVVRAIVESASVTSPSLVLRFV